MSQVSRRMLNKEVEERINELLSQAIHKLRSKEEISDFLEELLTPTEKLVLSKRLAIAVLLAKKYDYNAIKDLLKVTSATIARISYWMRYRGRSVRKVIDLIVADANWENFWNKVDYLIGRLMVLKKDRIGVKEEKILR